MHLTLYTKSFWPASQWTPANPERPISLPLGGGEVRVMTGPGDRALVSSACGEEAQSLPTPCDVVCRSSHESECVLEVLSDSHESKRITVVVGAGETFKQETLRDFADFRQRLQSWLSRTDNTTNALYEALSSGRLTILTRANPLSGLSTDYPLEELLSGCPSLLDICEHPRLHLHIEEEIRPIGVVRRSGPAAIKHLARHSEHWEARTVAGLRPARLLAYVLEDDWRLYENRFVITLLRKLRRYLRSTWEEIDGRLQQANSSINFYRITDYTQVKQPRALSYLLPDVRKDQIEESWLRLDDLHSRLMRLLRITDVCRQSRLYQHLHNCRDVQTPILSTNILAMDQRYRRARELWELIKDSAAVPESGIDGALKADLSPAFVDFCQVLTIAALDVSGFTPVEPNTKLVSADQSRFELQGDYRRRNWVISPRLEDASGMMPWIRVRWSRGITTSVPFKSPWHPQPRIVADRYELAPDRMVFYDRLTSDEIDELKRLPLGSDRPYYRQQWASFVYDANQHAAPAFCAELGLVPILSKLRPLSRHLDGITSDLLDHLLQFGSDRGLRSTFALLPVAFSETDEGTEAPENVVRRLLNFGDRYASAEAPRWGGFRAGIIPISRDQFPSLSRIAQLLNYQTTRFELENGFIAEECPLCGNGSFGEKDGIFSCHSETCGCVWLFSICAQCHNRFPTMKRSGIASIREERQDHTFSESLLASEELSDPRTGAAPQPFFCTNGVHQAPTVICPYCGTCSESLSCPRSCIYRSPISVTSGQLSTTIMS